MGRKCNVQDCPSDSRRPEDQGVTYHKMPFHSDLRPKWMSLCRVPLERQSNKVIYVCSRHFLRADFCNFKGTKYMLRQGALPSVFPWTPQPPAGDAGDAGDAEDAGEQPEAGAPPPSPAPPAPPEQAPKPEEKPKPKPEEKPAKKPKYSGNSHIQFVPGVRIEANDFNDRWYPARIVEVDHEDSEVLIHFEKYSNRYDEWIPMDSSRLRPLLPAAKKQAKLFSVGEKCMAVWSDSRRFPATVTKVLEQDSYEVLFDDGFVKVLKHHKLNKIGPNAGGGHTSSSSISASPQTAKAPLFDAVVGSKEERRERKRKHNVVELFSKKRYRSDDAASRSESSQDEDKAPAEDARSLSNVEFEEEWTCRWVNGEPVGEETVVETPDGPRRMIRVEDHRLPVGWEKHFVKRATGIPAGKWDGLIVSPDGKKFRTRTEIKAYMDEHKIAYNMEQFDFGLHLNRAKKLGLYEVTDENGVLRAAQPKSHHARTPATTTPKAKPKASKLQEELRKQAVKIIYENDAYKCPIEGCGKNFRKENLAQMHIKHYHPQYSKYIGTTPNVADLAYARTVSSDTMDESPVGGGGGAGSGGTPSSSAGSSSSRPKAPGAGQQAGLRPKLPPPAGAGGSKQANAEIIKLLSNDFVPAASYDMRCDEEAPTIAAASTSSSAASGRREGIKTLLPVVRAANEEVRRRQAMLDDGSATPKRRRLDGEDEGAVGGLLHRLSEYPKVIIEGGEEIKIVRMKREEIINCTCGITEEDGLMIQCELCCCWQHAYCNNIQKESQVPEKYVCYICQHPKRARTSQRHLHDQEWLKQGRLATPSYHSRDDRALDQRFESLRRTHDLAGNLKELFEFLHTLRVKINIAEKKDHPKLYLWAKPWDKPQQNLSYLLKDERRDAKVDLRPVVKVEKTVKAVAQEEIMVKEEVEEKEEEELDDDDDDDGDEGEEEEEEEEYDAVTSGKIKDVTELMSVLEGTDDVKPPIPISKAADVTVKEEDISSIMLEEISKTIEESAELSSDPPQPTVSQPTVPQPEAAIDPADCRLNLIEHISHYHKQVEQRLDVIEEHLKELEAQEQAAVPNDTPEVFVRTKQTVQMLLRDLRTMKKFSMVN